MTVRPRVPMGVKAWPYLLATPVFDDNTNTAKKQPAVRSVRSAYHSPFIFLRWSIHMPAVNRILRPCRQYLGPKMRHKNILPQKYKTDTCITPLTNIQVFLSFPLQAKHRTNNKGVRESERSLKKKHTDLCISFLCASEWVMTCVDRDVSLLFAFLFQVAAVVVWGKKKKRYPNK